MQTTLVNRVPDTTGSATRRTAKIAFAGQNGDFRRLATRGAIAELFTIGFYRFWLATAIRHLLWTSTTLEGEAFEYLGTGQELLFGFLLAVAILGPVYLAYFLVGIEVERFKAFASLPLALAFIAFRQFAIYRARRYRLNRTVWRGVRFGMTGSGWSYAARALKWGFLTLVTLGIAWPWAQAALERYKMSHTFYGELEGRFEGTGRQFFARGWGLWLAPILAVGVVLVLSAIDKQKTAGLVAILPLVALVGGPFWYAAYKAIEWRWWVEGLRLGAIEASSTLTRGSLVGNYWSFIGIVILIAMAGGLVATLLTGSAWAAGIRIPKPAPGTHVPLALVALWGLSYLTTLLAVGVAMRIYLTQRIWKIVCASTIVHGLEQADDVAARPGTANALGEGFADSLDILGF